MTTQEYIDQNKHTAIKEAVRSGVPASITIAQGIVESESGNSFLSTAANNNFGIKCHNDWTGDHVLANDDKPNECFRKYPTAADSFKDHIDFLKKNSRYQSLFSLPMDDYKGWANGLHQEGYATAPGYAQELISIIEKYNLAALDKKAKLRKAVIYIFIPIGTLLLALLLVFAIVRYRDYKQQLITG
jgi:flagellum-specific peptidoglycan hydrolase FlgJ